MLYYSSFDHLKTPNSPKACWHQTATGGYVNKDDKYDIHSFMLCKKDVDCAFEAKAKIREMGPDVLGLTHA